VKPRDLEAADVRRVGRVVGVRDGRPCLEDGTELDIANVIWCTGFQVDFSWIDLPACQGGDEPAHDRGVLTDERGVYLVGQLFQHALASTFIAGVGRDADHIAGVIASRSRRTQVAGREAPAAVAGRS
jgi:putative flavoprotein involved in K+ transport